MRNICKKLRLGFAQFSFMFERSFLKYYLIFQPQSFNPDFHQDVDKQDHATKIQTQRPPALPKHLLNSYGKSQWLIIPFTIAIGCLNQKYIFSRIDVRIGGTMVCPRAIPV